MKVLLIRIVLCMCVPLTTLATAHATTVTYSTSDISGSTWQYNYSIANNSQPGNIGEFTIFFKLGQYSNLAVQASPGNWSSIVAQPDPGLPADGFFDAQALDAGLPLGTSQNGFSVQFTWLGSGTPGTQLFNIVDPNTFATLETGNTSPAAPVPLPPSLALLISAFFGGALFFRRST